MDIIIVENRFSIIYGPIFKDFQRQYSTPDYPENYFIDEFLGIEATHQFKTWSDESWLCYRCSNGHKIAFYRKKSQFLRHWWRHKYVMKLQEPFENQLTFFGDYDRQHIKRWSPENAPISHIKVPRLGYFSYNFCVNLFH